MILGLNCDCEFKLVLNFDTFLCLAYSAGQCFVFCTCVIHVNVSLHSIPFAFPRYLIAQIGLFPRNVTRFNVQFICSNCLARRVQNKMKNVYYSPCQCSDLGEGIYLAKY